jgi:hypothetical protein
VLVFVGDSTSRNHFVALCLALGSSRVAIRSNGRSPHQSQSRLEGAPTCSGRLGALALTAAYLHHLVPGEGGVGELEFVESWLRWLRLPTTPRPVIFLSQGHWLLYPTPMAPVVSP